MGGKVKDKGVERKNKYRRKESVFLTRMREGCETKLGKKCLHLRAIHRDSYTM